MQVFAPVGYHNAFQKDIKFGGILCLSPRVLRKAEAAKNEYSDQVSVNPDITFDEGAKRTQARYAFASVIVEEARTHVNTDNPYASQLLEPEDSSKDKAVVKVLQFLKGARVFTDGNPEFENLNPFSFKSDPTKPVGLTFLINNKDGNDRGKIRAKAGVSRDVQSGTEYQHQLMGVVEDYVNNPKRQNVIYVA